MNRTIVLIKALRQKGLKIAIVSSSKNCKIVLEQAGLVALFDTRVDGVESATYKLPGKPAPDTYLEAARRLKRQAGARSHCRGCQFRG